MGHFEVLSKDIGPDIQSQETARRPSNTKWDALPVRSSLGLWVAAYVGDRVLAARDLVSLAVWDFDAELFLKGHHHLHLVQAIQAQVFLEACRGAHLQQEMQRSLNWRADGQ